MPEGVSREKEGHFGNSSREKRKGQTIEAAL
jgi:hypothetical protein